MSPFSHLIFGRAAYAVHTWTIGFFIAAIIFGSVPAVGATPDQPVAAALYGSNGGKSLAPHKSNSHGVVYAQWFDPFDRVFRGPGRNAAPRQNSESSPNDGRNDSQANEVKQKVIQALRAAPPPPPTRGPLMLVVSISRQTVTLYDAGVAVVQSPISSGTSSNPTPMGVFSVVEKQWWHRSNIYSAAPMPYMQRITWEGVALHAGELPGYAASHGCVRLPYDFALRLWGTTNIGTRVIIANEDLIPVEIAHPRLFTFKPNELQARDRQPEYRTAFANRPQLVSTPITMNVPVLPLLDVAPLLRGSLPANAIPAAKNLDRSSDPRAGSKVAATTATSSTFAEKRSTPDAIDSEAVDVIDDDALVVAPQFRETIDPSDTVTNGIAEISIVRPSAPTETSLASLEKIPKEADQSPAVAGPDTRLAPPPAPEPRFVSPPTMTSSITPAVTPERVLRPGPLSILVSQRDQRIYVRKGLEPLFDAPISIARLGQPLGTHVFTAVAQGDDGATMRWTVVTVTGGPVADRGSAYNLREPFETRSSVRQRSADKSSSTAAARAALDRLDIGREATDRISALMSVGATLIITDQARGTNKAATATDTDFMVLTR